MNRIKHININSKRLLVFGGVYSNLQALDAMKAVAEKEGFDAHEIICTGDVVAYCAQPEECVQAIKDWGIYCIAGNVELQLSEGAEDCGCDFREGSRCDGFSKEWYPYAQTQLSPDSLDWMKVLPEFLAFEFAGRKGMVLHGSYHKTAEFIFASTPWEVKQKNFKDSQAELILAGHSGLPFHRIKDNFYWLNAGVIGMPANDGTPRVWYMTLEEQDGSIDIQHHALSYDFEKAAKLMDERGLTASYAETLRTGIWDNCEILPVEETRLQGERIEF